MRPECVRSRVVLKSLHVPKVYTFMWEQEKKKKGLTVGSTAKSLLQFNQSAVGMSRGGVRGHTCGGTSCGVQEAGSGRIETAAFTGPWWRPRGWTERRSRCSWRSGRTCWCDRWPSGTRASLWSWTPPVWLQDTTTTPWRSQRAEEELQLHVSCSTKKEIKLFCFQSFNGHCNWQ